MWEGGCRRLYELSTAGRDRGGGVGGPAPRPASSTLAKLLADWLLRSSARIQDGDSVLEVEAPTGCHDSKPRNNASRTDVSVLTEHVITLPC